MSAQVIALGAWCDFVPPEEAAATPGGAYFRVHEFAILADGHRVTVRDDLGFSFWSRRAGSPGLLDPWRGLTRTHVEHDVRNVVLPDDDASEDEHPYEWLRELLLQQGIDASVEQLRSVPYTIEFSDRLERRLQDGSD